jgi:hypothetical protein
MMVIEDNICVTEYSILKITLFHSIFFLKENTENENYEFTSRNRLLSLQLSKYVHVV